MDRPRKKKNQVDSKSYHIQLVGSRFCSTPKSLVEAVISLTKARPDIRVWLLRGELGAGKTTVVRGVLRSLGITRTVTSPTYTLRQEYRIPDQPRYLVHIDAYRLRSADEAMGIGMLDDLHDPQANLWVEWPDRITGIPLPPAAQITIDFEKTGRRLSWKLPAEE